MSRFSYHIPILGYHRVGVPRRDHVPTVSAAAFERQLLLLATLRYQVLSLAQLVGRLERGERMPRHSVVITFDDGYEETCTVAWPLLKRFNFPAAVFITPQEVETPGFLTWEQAARMGKDGILIGSHTLRHSYLPLVPPDRVMEELTESKRVIEERLGQPVKFLSYPVGGFTRQIQEQVRQAGYQAACTTNRVASLKGPDPFALRRIKITDRDAIPFLFLAKLSGYYDLFRQLRAPS